MPTNILYGIFVSVTANGIIALARYFYARKHKGAVLSELQKQTSLLGSIARRLRGLEFFGTLSKNEEIKG